MRWTEISDSPETKRFELLSQELTLSKYENEFVPTELAPEFLDERFVVEEDGCERFQIILKQIKKDFDQIRIGGFFKEQLDLLSSEYPAELMQMKVLDSLVKTNERWWPRNQLFHGFIQLLTPEIKNVDFSAPILIVGANANSKTLVASLIKLGFGCFNLTDSNPEKCRTLVQELKRSFFSARFEMTEMGYITQLPNNCSMGISTLSGELDETTRMALIYFNFLPKGAFWIESSPVAVSVLANEALSFGFKVKLGIDVISGADFSWAKSALNCEINIERYKESLKVIYS